MKPEGSYRQAEEVHIPFIGLFHFLDDKDRPWQSVDPHPGPGHRETTSDIRTDIVTTVPDYLPLIDSNYAPYFHNYRRIRQHMDAFEYDRFLRLYQDVYHFLQDHGLYGYFTFDKSFPWYAPETRRALEALPGDHEEANYLNCVVSTIDEVQSWVDRNRFLDYPSLAPRLCSIEQSFMFKNDLSNEYLYYNPTGQLFKESVEDLKTGELDLERLVCIALFLDTPTLESPLFVREVLESSYFIRSFLEEYDADC